MMRQLKESVSHEALVYPKEWIAFTCVQCMRQELEVFVMNKYLPDNRVYVRPAKLEEISPEQLGETGFGYPATHVVCDSDGMTMCERGSEESAKGSALALGKRLMSLH